MASDDPYRQFAREERAVVVAPAGCGKTELIARAVAFCPSKQLVLTHTHAGVDALRARLRRLGILPSRYQVETIHSFALRYAAAYPKSSCVKNVSPRTNEDYRDIIESAYRLMKTPLIRKVLSCSYGGAFVDEYQDCTIDQHNLIVSLADTLPCRIVGDPLQGIFDFADAPIVDWEQDVYPAFQRLPDLKEPWRWKDSNPQLGAWLAKTVRPALENGEPVVLPNEEQSHVCMWTQDIRGRHSAARRIGVLKSTLGYDETTFVICNPSQVPLPHFLAASLKNCYRSLEPITSGELHDLAKDIEIQTGANRLQAVFAFANACLTGQGDCDTIVNSIQRGSKVRTERHLAMRSMAKEVVGETSLAPVAQLLDFLVRDGTPTLKRHQLWHEMRKALDDVVSGSVPTLTEATHLVRSRGTLLGRRIPKRCISRTPLLKGLECQHAVVIDADSLDTRHLYVALTRGSKNLHILSSQKALWAADARRSCPRCGSELTPRNGKNGWFLGCSTYPQCRHTEALTGGS